MNFSFLLYLKNKYILYITAIQLELNNIVIMSVTVIILYMLHLNSQINHCIMHMIKQL